MITLIAPETDNIFTGGYLYNRRICSELDADEFSCVMLPDPPPGPGDLEAAGVSPDSLLLLDSLYLGRPGWVSSLKQYRRKSLSMLLHYLPSLDPFLSPAEAEKQHEAEQLCFAGCSRLAATSSFTAEKVRLLYKAPPAEIFRPGTAFNPEKNAAAERRRFREEIILLTVANWTWSKNHIFLVDVLKDLKDIPWRWKIFGADAAGAGPNSPAAVFRQKAAAAGIAERIEISGTISPDRVTEEMLNADIYLSPSLFESYGMTVAEALSAGLPVAANYTGGIPEVTGSSPGARLCTPGSREEWRGVIRELAESAGTRRMMSIAALERAEKLPSWKDTAEALLKFISGPSVSGKDGL